MKRESLRFGLIGARAANCAGELCGDRFQGVVRRRYQQKVTLDEAAYRLCRRVVALASCQSCRATANQLRRPPRARRGFRYDDSNGMAGPAQRYTERSSHAAGADN